VVTGFAPIRTTAAAAIACVLLLSGRSAIAQTAQTGEDPTRPILFSVRPEFYRVADDIWRLQATGRYDAAISRNRRWLGGRRGLLLRFEVPLPVAEHPAFGVHAGLGDAYGQVLIVPRLSRRFAVVAGSGLSIPIATHDLLGSGKWIVAPAAIPVFFFPRGLWLVKVQNFTSIAGDDERADVNFLLITPTLLRAFGRASWILVDTETKTDWRLDRRTGVKSGIQLGHIFGHGVGLWLKPEVWWGANQSGDWNLKTGIVWYRDRKPNP